MRKVKTMILRLALACLVLPTLHGCGASAGESKTIAKKTVEVNHFLFDVPANWRTVLDEPSDGAPALQVIPDDGKVTGDSLILKTYSLIAKQVTPEAAMASERTKLLADLNKRRERRLKERHDDSEMVKMRFADRDVIFIEGPLKGDKSRSDRLGFVFGWPKTLPKSAYEEPAVKKLHLAPGRQMVDIIYFGMWMPSDATAAGRARRKEFEDVLNGVRVPNQLLFK